MKKYKVTKEFMGELEAWKNMLEANVVSINEFFFDETIKNVEDWRSQYVSQAERNQRFGAIVNWINGEDVFEIGTTKYIVKRTRNRVLSDVDEYVYLNCVGSAFIVNNEKDATRFITFEKASEWANKHFEVVEVDE